VDEPSVKPKTMVESDAESGDETEGEEDEGTK
jgi:hypothetical protein